uniref:Uncharacterized protein n=3 Tax=unclassified Prevotella TaxID=2638335 RepID=A0AB33JML7_9BACT
MQRIFTKGKDAANRIVNDFLFYFDFVEMQPILAAGKDGANGYKAQLDITARPRQHRCKGQTAMLQSPNSNTAKALQ